MKTKKTMLVLTALFAAACLAACSGDDGDTGRKSKNDPPKFSCSAGARCGNGLICSDGVCVESAAPQTTEDQDDPASDNTAQSTNNTCKADPDCTIGHTCKNGACVTAAETDDPTGPSTEQPSTDQPSGKDTVPPVGYDNLPTHKVVAGQHGVKHKFVVQQQEANQSQDSCKPTCSGKECGPDGCGGLCGKCPDDFASCSNKGLCQSELEINIIEVNREFPENQPKPDKKNYYFGDTVVLKVLGCEGEIKVVSDVTTTWTLPKSVKKINPYREDANYNNNTWASYGPVKINDEIVPYGIIVGSLIYDLDPDLDFNLTQTDYPRLAEPFNETITVWCGNKKSQPVQFIVAPPDNKTESLKGLSARLSTYHDCASYDAKVSVDLYDENGDIVVDTDYQDAKNSGATSIFEGFNFTMKQTDTKETLDKITDIAALYRDNELGCDWYIHLYYIAAATKNLYLFYWAEENTKVDEGKWNETSSEKEIFNLEKNNLNWQIRCSPELPEAYITHMKKMSLPLPVRKDKKTCSESYTWDWGW